MPATRASARRLAPVETIEKRIFAFRGHRVILDRDLAELYGVELKRLNEQVKRNRERFPADFMFQLTLEEGKTVLRLRSQIATLKRGEHIKYRPYVFTEHGAVMLANVLRSHRRAGQHPGCTRLREHSAHARGASGSGAEDQRARAQGWPPRFRSRRHSGDPQTTRATASASAEAADRLSPSHGKRDETARRSRSQIATLNKPCSCAIS